MDGRREIVYIGNFPLQSWLELTAPSNSHWRVQAPELAPLSTGEQAGTSELPVSCQSAASQPASYP